MKIGLVQLSCFLVLLVGCSSPEQETTLRGDTDISSTPLNARATGSGDSLFEAIPPEQSGINPSREHRPDHPAAYMQNSGMEAGGVAVGDVDGDGLPDLFLASSPGNNRLYRQISPLKFADITPGSGLDKDNSWGRGASLVDIDNDGDLDLFLANYAEPNQVFINVGTDGSVQFEERGAEFGLDLHDASLMPAFCDYDHDGDLDLYLMANQFHWPKNKTVPKLAEMLGNESGKPVIKSPYDRFFRIKDYQIDPEGGLKVKHDNTGRPDRLYRNDGGKFTNVTTAAGLPQGHGRGLSPTWWDYNNDGLMDIYVANDWADRDSLFRNNGDGTFTDTIEDAVPYTSMFTMGSDTGDLNNDGRIDFFAADMSGTTHYKRKVSMGSMQAEDIEFMLKARPPQNMRNAVYLNTGTDRVLEAAYMMGLANSDWSWAVKIADFDNDGRNDVFITNGMEQNLREVEGSTAGTSGQELRKEKNLAFRNAGNLRFEESGASWGLDHFGYSIAAANCDFDRDGDLDLFVIHRDEPPQLYKNTSSGNAILIELKGKQSNRNGIGATLHATTASGVQVRQIIPTRGYLTSDELVAHFGLGDEEEIITLSVTWPSGHLQTFENLSAGNFYTIEEPSGKPPVRSVTPPDPLFVPDEQFPLVSHRERSFDDFAAQPLLPNKLSQLGPGLAVGDIDGDGDEDLVLGGAAGAPTQLVTNTGDGKFSDPRALPGTETFEDMGVLLFDSDADGDRDLFIVSGGIESSGAELADRLYLNDGKGEFSLAPAGTIPSDEDSGGPVTMADIDRDGDLDLFVGCRTNPGRYPTANPSHLLINNGGTFTSVSVPGLGLVTSATFADVDGDGWQDLLVAREWGSVAYLRNESGRLVDQTAGTGLENVTGWWNGVAVADLDLDGDMDIVATNFGYNTKYHASEKHPALLYYGSFGTDTMRIVEAEFEGEHLLPVRGKSCSTQAIPHLAEKFKTYHDFALANVSQIYSDPVVREAEKYSANTLASGVFINHGEKGFDFKPLPRLAQIAPSFGIAIRDFDGDGNPDIFLSQNFHQPQPETGRMSGGLGLLLRGLGNGEFDPMWPDESGLRIPEDATAACVTDFNNDARPDLLVASNDGPLRSFINHSGKTGARVKLRGHPGNPDATGARVTVFFADGKQHRIASDGQSNGYLSQSTAQIFIPEGQSELNKIEAHWPDGSRSEHSPKRQDRLIEIFQPKSN